MSFISSLFNRGGSKLSQQSTAKTKIALITNFSACPLGINLLNTLSESNTKVLAVSHDALRFYDKVGDGKVGLFEAFLNEEEDRNRLISYLVDSKMQVATLVQN